MDATQKQSILNESPLASVTVVFRTVISSVAMANDTLTVSFPTAVDITFQLEFTTNRTLSSHWQPVHPTPGSGTGQPLTLTDLDVAGQSQRFYRRRPQLCAYTNQISACLVGLLPVVARLLDPSPSLCHHYE